MFDERSVRLDVCRLDDRPPFLDGGAVQGAQRLWRLLVARRDLLAEIGEAPVDRGIGHRLDDATISAGVPFFTHSPVQYGMTSPGRPCSSSVGMSGAPGQRDGVKTPKALILPACT
jgi:hypothetical protein